MIEALSAKNQYTLKQILKDHWKGFLIYCTGKGIKIRPAILENVKKVLSCRDPDRLGYHRYQCPNGCDDIIVPHSCKSRFCSSCGKIANDRWIEERNADLLNVPHHHVVFTVPRQLWAVFAWDRKLLDILFISAKDTILSICIEKYGYVPGIVMVLHTFGSKLNLNTHIHILVTKGGLSLDRSEWVLNDHIPWKMLKSRWKYNIVSKIKPKLKKMIAERKIGGIYGKLCDPYLFNSFFNELYKKTWYVWWGAVLVTIVYTAGYVGRYAKRPAMAESRIKDYDGEYVVFEYEDKVEKVHKVEKLPVYEFLGRLVRHIHDKYFRCIRYAGIYSNRTKTKDCDIAKVILGHKARYVPPKTLWRERRMRETGEDPLECSFCGATLVLREVAYQTRDGPCLERILCS